MNEILQLKGPLQSGPNPSRGGGLRKLPPKGSVSLEHIRELRKQLKKVLDFWSQQTIVDGVLVSVYYREVIAKSNRISAIFAVHGKNRNVNTHIRGAKFWHHGDSQGHIITYYLSKDIVSESIANLEILEHEFDKHFGERADFNTLEEFKKQYIRPKSSKTTLSRSALISLIVDAYYVDSFDAGSSEPDVEARSLVSFYDVGLPVSEILRRVGIRLPSTKVLNRTTVLLEPKEFEIVRAKASFLVAMQTTDIGKLPTLSPTAFLSKQPSIPQPSTEPVIGVIDTLFDENVYFHEWVDFQNMVPKGIPIRIEDYGHGTAVTSLIVDGPGLNPNLDDHCGYFRVKHFGVAVGQNFSSFEILKKIREAVSSNPEIKVWNLSLGSNLEINPNYISPEAAELDQIQVQYDVIFVVAGTNDSKSTLQKKIGAPADSLNAMVVNSVDSKNTPASYSRRGPVLSFFTKPDVSVFGGDNGEKINVCKMGGVVSATGTSFAAPWIARKLAYLIYKLNFSKETAKALLIDAASAWETKNPEKSLIGWGVVPQRIQDIITTPDDEIRFIITGAAQEYETYTYDIPVPQEKDLHPFYARAVMCSFPKCDRDQGVDYTCTEMDLHFGRVVEKNERTEIKSINANKQGDPGYITNLSEKRVREVFRKWDNVKVLTEELKKRPRGKDVYGIGNWGLNIKTKERMGGDKRKSLPFAVVITLKEIHGKNRITDFIQLCQTRGWIVNRVHVESRIEVYEKAQETIDWD